MSKAKASAAPIQRLFGRWKRLADEWREAPRAAFNSTRDWKRWNERHRGKPVDETPGALRVALTENKARR
jgi:hypothetical protein